MINGIYSFESILEHICHKLNLDLLDSGKSRYVNVIGLDILIFILEIRKKSTKPRKRIDDNLAQFAFFSKLYSSYKKIIFGALLK